MAKDVKVVFVDPVTRKVSLRVSSTPATGIELLVQLVILSLLNVPGQDILDPNDGGGIPEMIGMNIDASDSTEVLAEVTRRIKKTQTEVINSQTGLTLSPEEKLRDIFVVSVEQGENIDEVYVTIRIINEAGRISDVVV